MIDIEKYKKVLDSGLLLDHYGILISIRDGVELPDSKRITGFMNLLHKKGYLAHGTLTDLGLSLVGEDVVEFIHPVKSLGKIEVTSTSTTTTKKEEFDFTLWVLRLHEKLVKKIFEKTGKRQVRGSIQGSSYSFLPNSTDLGRVLTRAINAYRLTDFDKIEKCLLRYVDRKIKEDSWFPILQYYIMKKDMSAMVTDMNTMEEDDKSDIDNDSTVNI